MERLNPPPPEGSERVRIRFRNSLRILRTQRVKPGPAHSASRSEVGPLSIIKLIKIMMSFWYRFWCLLGPFWPPKTTPFGDQNRPKIVPRGVLRLLVFKKVDFPKNERHPRREHDIDPPGAPRWSQDRPKIAPRRS